MPLSAGSRLGPYEIQSPLGAGGMGEVYRARDTRLERNVAVKVLPENLNSDVSLRHRLEREAKAISKLSHPHICAIYDVGHQDGVDFLVMELIEGETLEQRLTKGPLPPEQTLRYATQIADALVTAHKQSIIHRDLKPANIMLTRSGAKLMDFGLAKQAMSPSLPEALTETRMEGTKLTSEGSLIGTIQYMAPEQLEGKEADARTDIFALGEVIYEMATGSPAFSGKSRPSLIAAILTHDPPPICQLQPTSPPALDRIVRTCLAKDPDDRFQSAHDLKLQLEWIHEPVQQSPGASIPWARRPALWVAVAIAALALFAAFLTGLRWRTAPEQILQFEVNPPEKTVFNFRGLAGPPAVSPDGKVLAFVASQQGRVSDRTLWVRLLSATESRQVPGSEGAMYPFWSPDSRFLGYFASGKLKKLDVSGSTVMTVCDVAEGRGGTWSTDGVIVYGNRADSLFRVDAGEGRPVRLTRLDERRQETSHRWPQFLPDQKRLLFVAQAPELPSARLFVTSLDSHEPKLLEGMPPIATFTKGYLLYAQETNLLARPFDSDRLQFTGDPVSLARQVQTDSQFNNAVFSVSGPVLIFQTRAVRAGTRLVAFDRSGKETLLSEESDLIQAVALSPQGDQIAASLSITSGQLNDVWIYNLLKKNKTKVTFDQRSFYPVWSPDGKRIAINRGNPDGYELVIKDVAGGGFEQVVYKGKDRALPLAWSPDGNYLFCRMGLVTSDIKVLSLKGDHKSVPLLTTRLGWAGMSVSADGKWLAYVSDDTVLPEVYVVPVHWSADGPALGSGKWQVSIGGGTSPVWRPDGKALFFVDIAGKSLVSVRVNTAGDRIESDPPEYLFDLSAHPTGYFYAPSRDGQTIYMTTYGPGSSAPITITVNWQGLLKK